MFFTLNLELNKQHNDSCHFIKSSRTLLLTTLLERSFDLPNENATRVRQQNASTFATTSQAVL